MIEIGLLQNISNAMRYTKNQMILQDGEKMGNEMYIILKGSVNVYKNFYKSRTK